MHEVMLLLRDCAGVARLHEHFFVLSEDGEAQMEYLSREDNARALFCRWDEMAELLSPAAAGFPARNSQRVPEIIELVLVRGRACLTLSLAADSSGSFTALRRRSRKRRRGSSARHGPIWQPRPSFFRH